MKPGINKVKKEDHLRRVSRIIELLKDEPMNGNELIEVLGCSKNSVGRALTAIRNLGLEVKQDFKYRYYIVK